MKNKSKNSHNNNNNYEKNNIENTTPCNGYVPIHIYKKMKPIKRNNINLHKNKIESTLTKNKQKLLYDKDNYNYNCNYNYNNYNNNTMNNNNYYYNRDKSKSKSKSQSKSKSKSKKNKDTKNIYDKFKTKTACNNDKLINNSLKDKMNLNNKMPVNYNENKNIPLNNNINNKNISINLDLTHRTFLNKKPLINKALLNKLKINLKKNNHLFRNIGQFKDKNYNTNKLNLLTSFPNDNKFNNILLNKTLNNKKNKKEDISNIKNTKSYRLDNINNKNCNIPSIPITSNGKTKDKNILTKFDKNNFLNIFNNITNKKNFNDKQYIHINSIEINNIIKGNEKKEDINKDNNTNNHIYQKLDMTNEELMNKIKNSIDENLRVMLNFSYENFLSKESERSKDFNGNNE
jgi:hypothetical protein